MNNIVSFVNLYDRPAIGLPRDVLRRLMIAWLGGLK